MTTPAQLWRALRDLSLALLGLTLAIFAFRWDTSSVVAVCVWGFWFLLGAAAKAAEKYYLPQKPVRGLRALEFKVVLLYSSSSVFVFSVIFLVLGLLSAEFSGASEKYWFGAASGFILAGISVALISPGKDVNWIASRAESTFKKVYEPYFKREDSHGVLYAPEDFPEARWSPIGREAEAIYEDSLLEGDDRIEGWGKRERIERAKIIASSM